MKTILSIIILVTTMWYAACGDNSGDSKESSTVNKNTASQVATNTAEPKNTLAIDDIVLAYLNLKNALTTDNGKEAANAAGEITASLAKVDETALTGDQKNIYNDIKDDIKEHGEHIAANGSNIEHQREHFDLLSRDVIDLIKTTGSSKTLYIDFCPMYNNKKGASWLSETKDIKNPYYGNKMLQCGEVKQEVKAKG